MRERVIVYAELTTSVRRFEWDRVGGDFNHAGPTLILRLLCALGQFPAYYGLRLFTAMHDPHRL
jgi:hypothetical protein